VNPASSFLPNTITGRQRLDELDSPSLPCDICCRPLLLPREAHAPGHRPSQAPAAGCRGWGERGAPRLGGVPRAQCHVLARLIQHAGGAASDRCLLHWREVQPGLGYVPWLRSTSFPPADDYCQWHHVCQAHRTLCSNSNSCFRFTLVSRRGPDPGATRNGKLEAAVTTIDSDHHRLARPRLRPLSMGTPRIKFCSYFLLSHQGSALPALYS
jgi:hypothetical protein